jgi:dsDNA-specific endonuclease/ATPase MutS2
MRGRNGLSWVKRIWAILFASPAEPPPEEEPPEEEFPEEYVVTDMLDLHGFFPEQVPEVLNEFLENASRLGLSEVRVVHGKGRSVLRREVLKILKEHPLVIEYGQAPPDRGGWGATLARLVPSDTPGASPTDRP